MNRFKDESPDETIARLREELRAEAQFGANRTRDAVGGLKSKLHPYVESALDAASVGDTGQMRAIRDRLESMLRILAED